MGRQRLPADPQDLRLERYPLRLNRSGAPGFSFVAFSGGEPVSISPETLELDGREGAGSSTPMNLSRLNGAQALVAAAILAAVLLAAVVGTVALVIREQIRVVEAVEHGCPPAPGIPHDRRTARECA